MVNDECVETDSEPIKMMIETKARPALLHFTDSAYKCTSELLESFKEIPNSLGLPSKQNLTNGALFDEKKLREVRNRNGNLYPGSDKRRRLTKQYRGWTLNGFKTNGSQVHLHFLALESSHPQPPGINMLYEGTGYGLLNVANKPNPKAQSGASCVGMGAKHDTSRGDFLAVHSNNGSISSARRQEAAVDPGQKYIATTLVAPPDLTANEKKQLALRVSDEHSPKQSTTNKAKTRHTATRKFDNKRRRYYDMFWKPYQKRQREVQKSKYKKRTCKNMNQGQIGASMLAKYRKYLRHLVCPLQRQLQKRFTSGRRPQACKEEIWAATLALYDIDKHTARQFLLDIIKGQPPRAWQARQLADDCAFANTKLYNANIAANIPSKKLERHLQDVLPDFLARFDANSGLPAAQKSQLLELEMRRMNMRLLGIRAAYDDEYVEK